MVSSPSVPATPYCIETTQTALAARSWFPLWFNATPALKAIRLEEIHVMYVLTVSLRPSFTSCLLHVLYLRPAPSPVHQSSFTGSTIRRCMTHHLHPPLPTFFVYNEFSIFPALVGLFLLVLVLDYTKKEDCFWTSTEAMENGSVKEKSAWKLRRKQRGGGGGRHRGGGGGKQREARVICTPSSLLWANSYGSSWTIQVTTEVTIEITELTKEVTEVTTEVITEEQPELLTISSARLSS